ncbi:MAG: cell division protein ZapE [Thioalkalispiraceae bacterium]|jgi:cell division protein ZapE
MGSSQASLFSTPAQRYQQDLSSGAIQHDPAQQHVVDQLQLLYEQLLPTGHQAHGWVKKLFSRDSRAPRGLYLWGGTGRGKTYLMDSFYASVSLKEKYRVHYHRFMLDVHEQLKGLPKSPDPLNIVARQLASRYRLLCLDEFHVHDIADAMLMAGLLKALFNNGVTLVATSNIAISDLYKNGLQRERFMSAIELLHEHTREVKLDDGPDYRLNTLEDNQSYQLVAEGEGKTCLKACFEQMATVPAKHNRALIINDRPIRYLAQAGDLIWFDFRDICATYRSANDYIEIARVCHTVFISDIHPMTEAHDDVAKRFIHLVDALYDHHVKLLVTARVEAAELYQGRRLAFAFQRTISRLNEMGTNRYLSLTHIE